MIPTLYRIVGIGLAVLVVSGFGQKQEWTEFEKHVHFLLGAIIAILALLLANTYSLIDSLKALKEKK